MSDDRTRDEELLDELDRLGEPEADAEEIAAAQRLATRLEGSLHVVDPADDGDLSGLAQTIRSATGVDTEAGVAVTDRVMADIFDRAEGATDAPADELEQRRAQVLASGVERLIAGCQQAEMSAEMQELLFIAAMIRASTHAGALSPGRLETLVDRAYGAEAPPAPAVKPRRLGTVVTLALAAALAVLVVGAALLTSPWRAPGSTATQQLPTHLTSRSTRDILPGAFPRSQSSSERIDLIYHDRLRSYRALSLGAADTPSRRGR